jgi:YihY family inner membrane protein
MTVDASDPGVVGRGKALAAAVDRWQQRHPVVGFPYAVIKKFGDDQAGNLAALVSYYVFFSLFPLLLAFTTILGFVLADNPELHQRLVDSALSNFPIVGDQLGENIGSLSGNTTALIIGVVGALWAGMGAIGAMQNAMNAAWDVPKRDRPNLWQERLRSLLMVLVLGASVGVATAFGTVSAAVGGPDWFARGALLVATTVLNTGVYWLSFKILTRRGEPWLVFLPGAVVAGVAFTALQAVGGLYVSHVVQGASQTYGVFAVVLGLLSWLYLLAQVSVLAAEVNVVRALDLSPRSMLGDPLTDADRRALQRAAKVEERHADETIQVVIDQSTEPTEPAESAASDDHGAATDRQSAPSEA